MKVKDLIKQLQKLNQNKAIEICIHYSDGKDEIRTYADIKGITEYETDVSLEIDFEPCEDEEDEHKCEDCEQEEDEEKELIERAKKVFQQINDSASHISANNASPAILGVASCGCCAVMLNKKKEPLMVIKDWGDDGEKMAVMWKPLAEFYMRIPGQLQKLADYIEFLEEKAGIEDGVFT